MNIAYIVPKLANKGPINVVLELVNQMLKHGHQCKVFFFDYGNEVQFPCPTQRISFWSAIDFNKFDIIHTHGLRPDSYIFIHKPLHCTAKTISTLHNYIIEDFSYQYNKFIAYTIGNLWMYLLNRHDKIVVLTKNALKYYTHWFKPQKLAYVYNTRNISTSQTISEHEKEEILKFKGNSTLIGVNAALTPRKGIDQIIQALPFLTDYKLMIIGNGKSIESLKQQCINNSISNRVFFTGYKKDAYRFLPYYDIYALPSRSEGFVLTLIEAAIFKKNVVCSNIPAFTEVVTDSEVSFFKLENIPSLIKAIQRAKEKKFLGENLYKKYIQTFSPEIFYKSYYQIYKSISKSENKNT